jgi:hypothetical protein
VLRFLYPLQCTLIATTHPPSLRGRMEYLVSQIVSKQSLDALANLAFVQLKIVAEGTTRAKAVCNLDGSSGSALYKLLRGISGNSEESYGFINAFTTGAEFGIAVAAAVLTHQHDVKALCKAIKPELRDSSEGWPEHLRKIPEAA